jgi:N-acetylmuramoyl-L-alanine amidase
MRRFAPLVLWLVAVVGARAQAPLVKLPRTDLYGHAYIRLEDWARANNFSVKYSSTSPVVQVTNRWARLRFETDSRKAEIDGITVHLSNPIAKRSGTAFITALDLQTAVQPVLFPAKNAASKRVRTICLDPGHGGKDTGFVVGRQQEKISTLRLAQEVRDRLAEAGLNVILTRNSDSTLDIYDRPDIARRKGADMLVSLHFNSGGTGGGEAHGSEVYCMTPVGASSTNARGEGAGTGAYPGNKFNDQSLLLAYQIQKRLGRDLDVEDRGVRRARFVVLKETTMPAVLIEGGYLSHPTEGRKIADPVYLRQLAGAIADGILAYQRLVERSPDSAPSKATTATKKKKSSGPATASTR